MSEKKNTPISIYGKNKRLTDTITYKVDGVRYRETISLDTANGNFGKSLKIEVQDDYIYPGTEYFVPVTNKEILEKLQKDSARMNEYGTHLQGLNTLDGAEEAFDASGLKELAYGDKSWSNIPLPVTGGENDKYPGCGTSFCCKVQLKETENKEIMSANPETAKTEEDEIRET